MNTLFQISIRIVIAKVNSSNSKTNWSGCRELNPVPHAPHARILPMNYTPILWLNAKSNFSLCFNKSLQVVKIKSEQS